MSQDQDRPKLHIEGDWKTEVERERAAEETPKIQVDSDWKAQAQAEKERLAEQEDQKDRSPSAAGRELPEANFRSLVGILASQAVMGLGAMKDPQTGGVMIDLEGARLSIDLLGVLEEKTKGNLDGEEEKELTQVLAELRSRYVQVNQLVAQQMAADASKGPAGGPLGG